jgi:peptide deformylase
LYEWFYLLDYLANKNMADILQKENKILRQIASNVSASDITKPKIRKILDNMSKTLDGQNDAVALAAPQIGVSLRIFVVSGKIFNNDMSDPNNIKVQSNLFFINPVIVKMSKDKKFMDEGCLSVRPFYGKVRRATKAKVEAYNELGKKFTLGGSGLLANIFQHEIDHLDGILFIDKAKDINEVL